jgi:prevent-host-death family protein
MRKWQLQEAKNKLSEVVEEAINNGPQLITRRGVASVILLSCEEYRRLNVTRKKLSTFFRESPLATISLDLERDKSPCRPEAIL